MTDYAKNTKKYNNIFQKCLKRRGVITIPSHESDRGSVNRTVIKTRSNKKVIIKKKINDSNEFRNFCDDKILEENAIGNPFYLSPNQQFFTNIMKKDIKKVAKIPFILSEPHTICDLDKDFYKLIEGRPIRKYIDHEQHLRDIATITNDRVNAAYLKDLIFQFQNLSHAHVEKEYEEAVELYGVINEQFQQFLEDSWESVKIANAEAETKYEELKIVLDNYDKFCYELIDKKYEINNISYVLSTLDKYRKFLYMVAPVEWRQIHDKEFEGVTYYFDNYETLYTSSLDMVRKSFTASQDLLPWLYFTTPAQLIDVFENISGQCLNYVELRAVRSSITTTVIQNRDYLVYLTTKEAEGWKEKIEIFEKKVDALKEQEIIYKNAFRKLLFRNFYKLYASFESSKLLQCLQDVNDAVINDPKVPSDSVSALAQQLEDLYMELMSDMDKLNPQVVKATEKTVFSESLKLITKGKLSQRQLREYDILRKALYTSFEPPRVKKVLYTDTKNTRKSI